MKNRSLFTTLAITALIASACGDATQEQSPGEVLARDSSLASELKQADTSAFAEAADVAMAFNPDSALPPVNARPAPTPAQLSAAPALGLSTATGSTSAASPATSPATLPASTPAAPTSTPSVPMRVSRPAATPATPPARAPMRPAPATIHPEPMPGPMMPARPLRATSAAARAEASANEILAKVPGAALPVGTASGSTAPSGADAPCSSPAAADQRRCLMLHLARSDEALDRTYQALISAMKREAGTPAGGKEPESVRQLRAAQRAWLVYRDTECRRRNPGGEGPLWASVRAECLGEFSGNREAELARALRERTGG